MVTDMWHFIVCFGDAEAYFIPVSAFFQVSDINNHVVVTSANKAKVMCSFYLPVCRSWCYDLVHQLDKMVNFWWGSSPRYGFRITFPFSSPLRNGGF